MDPNPQLAVPGQEALDPLDRNDTEKGGSMQRRWQPGGHTQSEGPAHRKMGDGTRAELAG